MNDFGFIYKRLEAALSSDDVAWLRAACKAHILADDAIPSYVLIDHLDAPVVSTIGRAIERELGEPGYYLNDFYFYTDRSFGADWHMDTELFSFARAINAWVLLSPEQIEPPLSFLSGYNDSEENYFHNIRVRGSTATFSNFSRSTRRKVDLADLDASVVASPPVSVGDILLLNPKYFHRTRTTLPKHCIAIKYVFRGPQGFLSDSPVPEMYWKEVGVFREALKQSVVWDDFLASVRKELTHSAGRKALSAGFYPEKLPLYREMVQWL